MRKRKIILALAVLFTVNILIISLVTRSARAESYQRGSVGQTVKQVQERLKKWGYYAGEIDG
ncbi:MAG: spore cortex-lytic enzyme, partial [Oscillospiraceae bacterium]|nr:spore cortex-lytic enzyme [Oscillospiraceae bacterium]